jgi:hypothetical protein
MLWSSPLSILAAASLRRLESENARKQPRYSYWIAVLNNYKNLFYGYSDTRGIALMLGGYRDALAELERIAKRNP